MSVARGGPNIPTSVDAVGGRMVETPPPAAARSAPAHAADLLFAYLPMAWLAILVGRRVTGGARLPSSGR